MNAKAPLGQQSPLWPPRTDPNETACALWRRQAACLSVLDGGGPEGAMLTAHDICLAVHAIASSLRTRCTMDRAERPTHTCLPLVALEQLLRLLDVGEIPPAPGVDVGREPQELLPLHDLVRRAVRAQDPVMHEDMSIRLTKVLAGTCESRRALPASPDAASYV